PGAWPRGFLPRHENQRAACPLLHPGLTSRPDAGGNETMATPGRALPQPTPETQHFWDGAKAEKLLLQRCDDCSKVYFPPRPFCPVCASRNVSVTQASGKAKLYSYVIHHRPVPGFTPPYAIAVV